jgi:hypothetical protein
VPTVVFRVLGRIYLPPVADLSRGKHPPFPTCRVVNANNLSCDTTTTLEAGGGHQCASRTSSRLHSARSWFHVSCFSFFRGKHPPPSTCRVHANNLSCDTTITLEVGGGRQCASRTSSWLHSARSWSHVSWLSQGRPRGSTTALHLGTPLVTTPTAHPTPPIHVLVATPTAHPHHPTHPVPRSPPSACQRRRQQQQQVMITSRYSTMWKATCPPPHSCWLRRRAMAICIPLA